MTPLQTALAYLDRGWSVIPVPYRGKNPGYDDWPQLRIKADEAPRYFNGQPQNIGLLTGEPSGWIVDVDLDHPLAVELAPQFLPPTAAIFGRVGKPRSHWLYRVTAPVSTKIIRSKSAGTIVELRSTSLQTVIPPSVHETGEPITWDTDEAEPAAIDPEVLRQAVIALGDTVKIRLGEKQAKRPAKKKPPRAAPSQDAPAPQQDASVTPEQKIQRCLAAMLRIGITDHKDGSRRLFAAACRTVEHDLSDAQALEVIRTYIQQRPFRRAWTDEEIVTRIRDAEGRCERGKALRTEPDGLIPLGNRDPVTGKLVLSPKRTLPTADAFLEDFHLHRDGRTLHSFGETLLHWRGNRYAEVEEGAIRQQLQGWLHGSLRYVFNKSTKELELGPFESNPATVNAALETIRHRVHLPTSTPIPSWLKAGTNHPPPQELLACPSFLFHLPTQTTLTRTPSYFTLNALEFDAEPQAPPPAAWLGFLHQLFDGDVQSLDLLQEWFGYCLTSDTSQQKMLFMYGPKRSGKGTVARVLSHLIGLGNVCGPTTSSLAGDFGLQPLIGKSLAVVSDARFSGEKIAIVVERLLTISGEDIVSIDRKFLPSLSMQLGTRFMFLSNELPRLNDASGALAGRFLILRLTQSFYGREDPQLTNKLLAELPGILNWSIEGWKRLRERGHFVMPQSAEEAVRELDELSAPIKAFLSQRCVVGAGHRVWVDDLYAAWCAWSLQEGRQKPSTKPVFGRDLAAALPEVNRRRGADQQPFYEGLDLKRGES
jgi:putative DNA primase/helicase